MPGRPPAIGPTCTITAWPGIVTTRQRVSYTRGAMPKPPGKSGREFRSRISGWPESLNEFHLPILQVDGRPPTEEVDDCNELVMLASTDDFPGNPGQWTGQDADGRPHRHGGLGRDSQSRAEHFVDLLEVTSKRFLVDDLENIDKPMAAEHGESVVRIAVKEQVTREKRHDRPDLRLCGVRLSLTAWGR